MPTAGAMATSESEAEWDESATAPKAASDDADMEGDDERDDDEEEEEEEAHTTGRPKRSCRQHTVATYAEPLPIERRASSRRNPKPAKGEGDEIETGDEVEALWKESDDDDGDTYAWWPGTVKERPEPGKVLVRWKTQFSGYDTEEEKDVADVRFPAKAKSAAAAPGAKSGKGSRRGAKGMDKFVKGGAGSSVEDRVRSRLAAAPRAKEKAVIEINSGDDDDDDASGASDDASGGSGDGAGASDSSDDDAFEDTGAQKKRRAAAKRKVVRAGASLSLVSRLSSHGRYVRFPRRESRLGVHFSPSHLLSRVVSSCLLEPRARSIQPRTPPPHDPFRSRAEDPGAEEEREEEGRRREARGADAQQRARDDGHSRGSIVQGVVVEQRRRRGRRKRRR